MLQELKLKILEAEIPRGMPVKFVAIDGHGGAGKTMLAQKLSACLNAEIIHTDDFASFDKPMDWWEDLVQNVFEPVKAGAKTLSYKRGSWYKTHKPKPITNQPVSSVIIVEGVSSSRKEFHQYLAYSIWIETPKDVCTKRGIARDLHDGSGKSRSEIEKDWRRWHAYEDKYIARDNPRQKANIVIDGTKSYE